MRIAIAGSGAMALCTAAQLAERGHSAVLWSPSGQGTANLPDQAAITSQGTLEGRWPVAVARSPDALVDGADGILIAVDAAGCVPVVDAIAPFVAARQVLMVSAALSLGGLYLSRALALRGVDAPVLSWSTSLGTASRTGPDRVDIRTVRPRIRVSVAPARRQADALAFCEAAFGPGRFEAETQAGAVAITLLANANPVFHVPAMLLNVTRIEGGETWAPYGQTTEAVGRLMEALDAERLAVGHAYGAAIHSLNEHFHRSFRTPFGSMAAMNAALHAAGRGPPGPARTTHRYLSQDIPYGLVVTAGLGRIAGVPTPIHDATVTVAGAALGQDWRAANTILPRLGWADMTKDRLMRWACEG